MSLDRRTFLEGAAAVAATATLAKNAGAAPAQTAVNLAAAPPAGFTPFSAPGKIVKVSKAGSLMPNQIYPKADDAKAMLEKAMTEFTGKSSLVEAVKLFVHPSDKVVVKPNGIAKQNMSTNKELILPFIDAMIAAGVPAANITVLEQYFDRHVGCRIYQTNLPAGVKLECHNNTDATMSPRMIPGTGVQTQFARTLTESTALINFSLIKDHSICGYTGMLKNMTHGCTLNPHDFHLHHASPQIAMLAAQDVLKSRLRLCITDAFKVMAHGGPLDKLPQYRFPYEAVLVGTDAVAMDQIGWEVCEQFRAKARLRTLTDEGRPPAYIKAAADLGLGISDRAHITLKEITV
jgi:uncharacterized protein (DUF362 family)